MTQRRTKEEEEKGGARRGYHTSAKVIIPGSGLYFPPVLSGAFSVGVSLLWMPMGRLVFGRVFVGARWDDALFGQGTWGSIKPYSTYISSSHGRESLPLINNCLVCYSSP